MLLEANKVYNLHYSFILEEVEEPHNNLIYISNEYREVLEEAMKNLNSADTPVNTQFIIKLNMSYSEGIVLGNSYIPLISLEKTSNTDRNLNKITVLNEHSNKAINQYKHFMSEYRG